MTTTDRMSDLNSRRELTDRLGETVILGNAIESGAFSQIAIIVAAAAGKSEVHVPFSMSAIASLDMQNASFGVWAVFLDIDATASVAWSGGTRWNSRLSSTATASAFFKSNADTLIGIQVFTSTAAYTPTAGTISIVVEAIGGGGGGGGCAAVSSSGNGSVSGGGGAGALAIGRITTGFSGVTVTVGAAGAGGAAGNNNGTAGGATTFGSVLTAGGGAGGTGGAEGGPINAGGVGGSASGSASIAGFAGERGLTGHVYSSSIVYPGNGGNSLYGGGGQANQSSDAGHAATGKGAGGSGAGNGGVTPARAGGTGTIGVCIIYEYNI